MKPKLVLTVGLPRSGKSTWAKRMMQTEVGGTFPRRSAAVVVNPDAIRLALHGQPFVATAEKIVWAMADLMVRSLFGTGHTLVILDACHVTRERRNSWRSLDWDMAYAIFRGSEATCLERVNSEELRAAIRRMAFHYEPLTVEEAASIFYDDRQNSKDPD